MSDEMVSVNRAKVEVLKVFYSLFTVLMDTEPEETLIPKLKTLRARLRGIVSDEQAALEAIKRQAMRQQSLRFASEIDWWHRNWHRDTGIPCDGTMEVCKRHGKCRTDCMDDMEEHDRQVRQAALRAAAGLADSTGVIYRSDVIALLDNPSSERSYLDDPKTWEGICNESGASGILSADPTGATDSESKPPSNPSPEGPKRHE